MDRTLNVTLALALVVAATPTPARGQDTHPVPPVGPGEVQAVDPVHPARPAHPAHPMQPARRAAPRPVDRAGLELVPYEIFDLTGWDPPAPVPPPAEELADPARAQAFLAELRRVEQERARIEQAAEDLVDAVKTHLTPPFEEGVHDVHANGGQVLVLLADAEQHAWTLDFLRRLSAYEDLVDVRAFVYSTAPGALGELGHEDRSEILDGAAAARLRGALDAATGGPLTAPRLLARPLQRASLDVSNELAFVQGWERRVVEPGGVAIADPSIGVIREGVRLEVRAVPLRGGMLGVDGVLSLTSVERPLRTRQVEIADDLPLVDVTLPAVQRVDLDVRLTLAAGQWALLVTPDPVEDREVAVLLSVDEAPADAGGR